MTPILPPANEVCEGYVFTGVYAQVVGVSMHRPTLENFTALHDQYSLLRMSLGTEWLIYAHFVRIECPYSVIFLARNLLKGESALEAVITNNALSASSQDVKQV